ncbi:Conserved_hypothetical protein [Hexamita inflata]|uniref:Uncharacterized protein n=1 Tax=Hexamita inflata TaxID=28002 RepID=A0AA86N7K9_9EUKA|nr:Conserved hypothetical protein [Hexamita inflata]CAI9945479.1 Conserved hypothetical protein [Hexamita inflata]
MENLPTDDIDSAISWEFQLWKQAEQARFRAGLSKLSAQRKEVIRKQYLKKQEEIQVQKNEKLKNIDQIQQEIQQTILKTQQKMVQYQNQDKEIKNQIIQTTNALKQQIFQAEKQAQQKLSECEQILATETANADQAQAQAAFFQNELQMLEKKRDTEVQKFQQFLSQQKIGQSNKIKEAIIKKQKEIDQNQLKIRKMEMEVFTVSQQLETLVKQIDARL